MSRKKKVLVHGYKRTKQHVAAHGRSGSRVKSYYQKRRVGKE